MAADILHSSAGVRPLCSDEPDELSAITYDYILSLFAGNGEPPLLLASGDKLTTCHKLVESALTQLQPFSASFGPVWTAKVPSPGGEQIQSIEALTGQLANRYAQLDRELALHWAHTYGTRVQHLLDGVNGKVGLGEYLGGGLCAREVDYLYKHEQAQDAEDISWHRGKLGLFLSPGQQVCLGQYLQSEHPHRSRVHAARLPARNVEAYFCGPHSLWKGTGQSGHNARHHQAGGVAAVENPVDLMFRALIGVAMVVLLTILSETRNYYITGLVPLFPTFALTAHYIVSKGRPLDDLKTTTAFDIWSIIPYFVYFAALYLPVERFRLETSLVLAVLAWLVATNVLVGLWVRLHT